MSRLLNDWQCAGPAYAALARRVRQLIREGQLVPETRIPPERTLAEQLGVSRTTVTKAYDLLRSDGHLHSVRGFGTVIAPPEQGTSGPPGQPGRPAGAAARLSRWRADFTVPTLPTPEPVVERAVLACAAEIARSLAAVETDPRGLPELRKALADRYTARGLPTSPSQLFLTQGTRHAWQLLLKVRARAAAPVLLEAPTSPQLIDAVRLFGARLCPVPLTPEGWQVDLIAAALKQVRPALAFLTPDFQDPTGRLMPEQDRCRLVEAAQRSGTLLVADESAAELWLDEQRLEPSMAAHDPLDTVALIGSSSSALGCGLPVGWIRAMPAIVNRLALSSTAQGSRSAVSDQVIAARLLDRVPELLAEQRGLLARRRDLLAAELRSTLPHWRFALPAGGTALWVDLGAPISTRLAAAGERHGLRLLPGPRFGGGGSYDSHLRLPYTAAERTLREGVRLLARAHEEATAGRDLKELF
ncbi:PLP-dependent aminotransferase family protein [Kitasatospora sp. NPDC006697]|uniref:aminotransferase-like domain-containing protein n=1 Tax=Kitasatospora sp. NPDC006697 TaxID=3364020 RepID=UPI003679B34D